MGKEILLAFIPLFVAFDPLGILPIFVSLTHTLSPQRKRKIIIQSIVTAFFLAVGFIVLGKMIFRVVGITMGDFMIAGGIVLFCIAIMDILSSRKQGRVPAEGMGAVPIGTPLIAGPAVLTTCLMMIDQYGLAAAFIAVLLNIAIVGIVLWWSDGLMRGLGKAGSHALSKVMALLLAALAVMMIRRGIEQVLG